MQPLNTSLFLVLWCLIVVPLAGIFWRIAPSERKWGRVVNWERMWEVLRGLEGEKSVVRMYYMREEYIVKIANVKRTTESAHTHTFILFYGFKGYHS